MRPRVNRPGANTDAPGKGQVNAPDFALNKL